MEKTIPPQSIPPLQPEMNQPVKSPPSHRSLFLLGIIFLVIILGGVSSVVGFVVGKRQVNSKKEIGMQLPTPEEKKGTVCTMDAKICPDGSSVGRTGPNCEFTECPVIEKQASPSSVMKTHKTEQLPGNGLKAYSLQYPVTWLETIKRDDSSDLFTLTKGDYKIEIIQGGMDGTGCIFEGEMPEGPMEDLRKKQYVELQTDFGLVRRYERDNLYSNDKNHKVFDFCMKIQDMFQRPTSAGLISYTVPLAFDKNILGEMDTIMKTLSK